MSVLSQQGNIVFEWENQLICVSFWYLLRKASNYFPCVHKFPHKSELCAELKKFESSNAVYDFLATLSYFLIWLFL